MVESLVFLEVSLDMPFLLSKNTALMLFCYFRQAERSVHYALSCPSQWSEFLVYYDKTKRTQIAEVIDMLKDSGAVQDRVPSREALWHNGLLITVVRLAVGRLCNLLKRSWSFSVEESSFFAATLEHLLRILHSAELPENDELLELRLDCFACHDIIGTKLVGLPEIRKAASIEHFLQSEYVMHVTFQDVGIHNS